MDGYIKDRYNRDSLGREDADQSVRPGQFQARTNFGAPQAGKVFAPIRKDRMADVRMARGQGAARPGAQNRLQRSDQKRNLLKQWNEQCQIHNISIPQLISSPTCSKRYRVTLTWLDGEGRPHQQDINFGEQGKLEYIDHKDPKLRDARISQLKQQSLLNPLHPNFWQFHMLNQYASIDLAYMKFVQENGLTNRKVVLRKQFRPNYNSQQAPSDSRAMTDFSATSRTDPRQEELEYMQQFDDNFRYSSGIGK